MPEWLFEAGIGECRAALVDHGHIVEAAIEPAGTLPVGTVLPARLLSRDPPRAGFTGGLAGGEAMLDRLPPGLTEGAALAIEIVREAIPEPGRPKLPRAVATDAAPRPGATLRDRLAGPVRVLHPHEPDLLEQAGWSELLEEARTGEVAFAGGALRIWPTPAMCLVDVDGTGPLLPLALAGARAAAAAVRRMGIGGPVGIDFPTLAGKADRQAVAAAIDESLPPPFERTAVNGFGFLQLIRPRPRPSLPELVRADPVGAAARALLRRLEREPPGPARPVRVPAPVLARIEAEGWDRELLRRTGRVPSWDRP